MGMYRSFFYVSPSNRSPVKEFIDSMNTGTRDKFGFVRELLEEYGFRLKQPYVKYLGKNILELRFSGKEGAIRVLYFFVYGRSICFTNGFVKKTEKTPMNEIEAAVFRRAEYLSRDKGEQ